MNKSLFTLVCMAVFAFSPLNANLFAAETKGPDLQATSFVVAQKSDGTLANMRVRVCNRGAYIDEKVLLSISLRDKNNSGYDLPFYRNTHLKTSMCVTYVIGEKEIALVDNVSLQVKTGSVTVKATSDLNTKNNTKKITELRNAVGGIPYIKNVTTSQASGAQNGKIVSVELGNVVKSNSNNLYLCGVRSLGDPKRTSSHCNTLIKIEGESSFYINPLTTIELMRISDPKDPDNSSYTLLDSFTLTK